MSGVETRNLSRDSLFLMAEIRLRRDGAGDRVKVRNLSPGGMMAEGGPPVCVGMKVTIKLRNLDWLDGNIAWVQDDRFGVAFAREIDPKVPRAPNGQKEEVRPGFARVVGRTPGADDDQVIRKL